MTEYARRRTLNGLHFACTGRAVLVRDAGWSLAGPLHAGHDLPLGEPMGQSLSLFVCLSVCLSVSLFVCTISSRRA